MIAETASRWAAALDRGLDAPEQAQLAAWLQDDPRHRGALLRAQAALSLLDRGRALSGIEQAAQDEAPLPSRRRWWRLGGAAVAAALVAGVGIGLWPDRAARIDTALGEIRRMPLADGSAVPLSLPRSAVRGCGADPAPRHSRRPFPISAAVRRYRAGRCLRSCAGGRWYARDRAAHRSVARSVPAHDGRRRSLRAIRRAQAPIPARPARSPPRCSPRVRAGSAPAPRCARCGRRSAADRRYDRTGPAR